MPFKRLSSIRLATHERAAVRDGAYLALWTGFFILIAAFFHCAQAQEKVLGMAHLSATTESLPLTPFTLIQPDPDRKVSPQTIIDSQGRVLNGAMSALDMISLGYEGVPVWLTIRVYNAGAQENWVIDLGRRSQGRLGYLKNASAYAMTISASGVVNVAPLQALNNKGSFSVNIPREEERYILLHLTPTAGKPAILPLKLYSQSAFVQQAQNNVSPYGLYSSVVLFLAAYFAAMAFTRREKNLFIYSSFFVFIMAAWWVCENISTVIGYGFVQILIPSLMVVFTLFSIALIKIFFNIEYRSFTERYVLYGLAWLNILATLLSFLLPVSSGIPQIALLYGAPLITLLILCLMSFVQSTEGGSAKKIYFIGAMFPVAGLLTTILGIFHVLPQNAFVINSLWYSVGIQGIFLVLACHRKMATSTNDVSRPRIENAMDFSRLREAKDNGEHTRLLKVIEKERELLADFRARENQRVDEMRQAKEVADEANRAKSAFLAVVSHEIRTPMTGVMGMVRLLLDSSITKQQRDYVLTIQESSEAMMALLNDILDFERIQRGKIELENISFDLHRLIQGLITLMSGHAVEKGISLSARIDDDLPKFVKGDPTRLRQVLLNLMGNAIKFTSKGDVTLLVRNISDDGKPAHPADDKYMIYFAVQDTGIGIPDEQRKNLFTPFAQANSTISRKFGGTGLGLAISKGLIETMGSTININSQEGEGSTFFFTLGMARGISGAGTQEKPVTRQETESHVAPIKILVVDDNAINRKVITGFLEQGRHDIVTADTAEDALAKIERDAFDLIFMDIELPGMSGNEATKILRSHRDRVKAAIPVIALTGNIAPEDRDRYLADGMSALLAKPIDADKLHAMVGDIAHKMHEREIRMPAYTDPFALTKTEFALLDDEEAQAPADRTVFNPEMLQSLKDTIGAKQLGDLLSELIIKTEEILGDMDRASRHNDLKALADRAHELKGMAGNFGLVEVSNIAAQAERKARAQETQDLGTLVGTLPDASLRAQNALREWTSH